MKCHHKNCQWRSVQFYKVVTIMPAEPMKIDYVGFCGDHGGVLVSKIDPAKHAGVLSVDKISEEEYLLNRILSQ